MKRTTSCWLSHMEMTKPIKLLCLIEAATVTGPAKNLLRFCRLMRTPEFCSNGASPVEVSIVTFVRGEQTDATDDASGSDNAFVAAAREAGVTVDVINERFRFDTQVIAKLREIVDRRAPDIIQTHMVKSHFLVKLSGLGKRYPWIAYHHGYTTPDLKMQVYNRFNRWSLPTASLVITVCDDFAEQLVKTGVRRDRIVVRHNSVTPTRTVTMDEQRALRTKLGIAGDERVLLSVGRLSKEKSHADLIESVSMLRQLGFEARFDLVMVGDGPERERLQSAIKARGLDGHIIFAGQVDDVLPYYAIADVLALPSLSEGSPNVLFEAMAAGLPIVATSVGGVPEIVVSEQSALLVPAREPRLLAAALHRVLTQPELAQSLSANAIARVLDFSPDAHARSLIRLYEQLLARPVTEPSAATSGTHNSSRVSDPVASTTPRAILTK
jgi:glycosyltransferase involved in cell wall biosynthesis